MSAVMPVQSLEQGWIAHQSKMGRPSDYSDELAYRVLECIATGRKITEFTSEDWSPSWTTIYLWAKQRPDFSQALARAREVAASLYAEEAAFAHRDALNAIQGDKSDSARVNAFRLKFEGMRWLAGVSDSKYSDKVQHQHTGNVGVSVSIAGLDREPIDVETVTDSVTGKLTD